MSELITLKNLIAYTPETGFTGLPTAMFLKSDDGADWYAARKHFSNETLKVAYRDDGIIYDSDYDASNMFPANLSISEVMPGDVPDDFEQPTVQTVGKWRYVAGKIEAVPEFNIVLAGRQRNLLMNSATARINALVEAQDDGDITPEEEVELQELRSYRTLLRRMDLTNPVWPKLGS
jgi:hypothetical protein